MSKQIIALSNLLSGVEILDRIEGNETRKHNKSKGSGLLIYDGKRPLSIRDITSNELKVIVCQHFPSKLYPYVTYIKVKDLYSAKSIIDANLYDWPSRKLNLIAVTGTNGKTTVVNLLYELFRELNYKVGVISTLGIKINGTSGVRKKYKESINKALDRMVDGGCEYCFMELHSHGIEYKKVLEGLHLKGAAILNVTHDHLDIHGSFENYFKAKKGLFDQLPSNTFALFNADNEFGKNLVRDTVARSFSFGISNKADFTGKIIKESLNGLTLSIDNTILQCKLLGSFNAYNLLAAYAVGRLLHVDSTKILAKMHHLSPIRGRIQMVPASHGYYCFVDFAHNPDGLKKILEALNAIKKPTNRLICVVGCGGNKDKKKRPIMANIALKNSEIVIFTSDNPRYEDPNTIVDDMKKGLTELDKKRTLTVLDRKKAIKKACMLAKKGDVVLISGKGHELYQDLGDEKVYFDDAEVLRKISD